MSLFKTRDLWSVSHPPNETYTSRHLAFFPSEHLISSKFRTDLILTASLEGTLRLFHVILEVSPDEGSASEATEAAPHHLLLETNLEQPILQLAVGHFSRYVFAY